MFHRPGYTPILKGKFAEFEALAKTSNETRKLLTPFIDIQPLECEKDHKGSLESHLIILARRLRLFWGIKQPLFLDTFYFEDGARMDDNRLPIALLLDELRQYKVKAIPVTNLNRDDFYNEAIEKAIRRDNRGACIRIFREDMTFFDELPKKLRSLGKTLKVSPEETHIILDFRRLTVPELDDCLSLAINTINVLPKNLKSLAVAGSGLPKNLFKVEPFHSKSFLRTELMLWKKLRNKTKWLVEKLSLADYGILSHELMNYNTTVIPAPKIRFTINDAIIILRGKKISSHPDGWKQFYRLAKILYQSNYFLMGGSSLANKKIEDCANSIGPSGTQKTWITINTCQHIDFAVKQVSQQRIRKPTRRRVLYQTKLAWNLNP